MTGGLARLAYEERLRELGRFSPDKRSFRGILSTPKGRVQRRLSQVLFSGTQSKDKRQWAQIPLKHKKKLLCWEGDHILEEVAQRGCSISTLGDTQNPTGHGPGQLVVGDPAWSRGVGLDDLRGAFPPPPFCKNVCYSML